MADRLLLAIGTKKGLFMAEAASRRGRFTLRGPFGAGVSVYAATIDTRRSPRVLASSCNAFFGMKLLVSTDLGNKFRETQSAPAFPGDDGRALANVWALEPVPGAKDWYAGVEPAALFYSPDHGNRD